MPQRKDGLLDDLWKASLMTRLSTRVGTWWTANKVPPRMARLCRQYEVKPNVKWKIGNIHYSESRRGDPLSSASTPQGYHVLFITIFVQETLVWMLSSERTLPQNKRSRHQHQKGLMHPKIFVLIQWYHSGRKHIIIVLIIAGWFLLRHSFWENIQKISIRMGTTPGPLKNLVPGSRDVTPSKRLTIIWVYSYKIT